MRLLAISDLHLSNTRNREALEALAPHPDDWLILAGDIAERLAQVRSAFALLVTRFSRVIWVPGNHELWTLPDETCGGGEGKYLALISLAREFGVVTPEDPYPVWLGPGGPCLITPLFLHYDYSFRPDEVSIEDMIPWAEEQHSVCADELLLETMPHDTALELCVARLAYSEQRLEEAGNELPKVLINHYPLRRDLVHIPRIPRFIPWCGTRHTEGWHQRFNVKIAVSGHLHVRRTDWRDGTRFEEVSLGYPRQWNSTRGLESYLREILPGPPNT